MATFVPFSKFFTILSSTGYNLDHPLFSSISDLTNVTRQSFNVDQCFVPNDSSYKAYPLLFSFYPNSDYMNKMFGLAQTSASVTTGGMLNMYRPVPFTIDTNTALYDFTSINSDGSNHLFKQNGTNVSPLKLDIFSGVQAGTGSIKDVTKQTGFYGTGKFSIPLEMNLGINDFLFKTTFVIYSSTGNNVFISNQKGFSVVINGSNVKVQFDYGTYTYQNGLSVSPQGSQSFTLSGLTHNNLYTLEMYRVGSTFYGVLCLGIPGLGDFTIVSQDNVKLPNIDFFTMNLGTLYVGDNSLNWEIRHLTVLKNPYLNYLYIKPLDGTTITKNNYVTYDLTNFDNSCFAYNSTDYCIYSCKDPTNVFTVDSSTLLNGTLKPVHMAPKMSPTNVVALDNQKWYIDSPQDGDQFFPYITDGMWIADDGSYYYFVSDTLDPTNADDLKIMSGFSLTHTVPLNVPNLFRKKGRYSNGTTTFPYTKIAYDTMKLSDTVSIRFDFITNTFKDSLQKVFRYKIGIKRFVDMAGTWKTSPYNNGNVLHFPYGSINSSIGASYLNSNTKSSSMVYFTRNETGFLGSYEGTQTTIDFKTLSIKLGTKTFYRYDAPFLNKPVPESMIVPYTSPSGYVLEFIDTFYKIHVVSTSTILSCGNYAYSSQDNAIIIGYSESGTHPIPPGTVLSINSTKTQISWPSSTTINSNGMNLGTTVGTFSGAPLTLSSPVPFSGVVDPAKLRVSKPNIWVSVKDYSTTQYILVTNFQNIGFLDINSTKNPPEFPYINSTITNFSITNNSPTGFTMGNFVFTVNQSDVYNKSLYTCTLSSGVTLGNKTIPSGTIFRFLQSDLFPGPLISVSFSDSMYSIQLHADYTYSILNRTTNISTAGKYRYVKDTNSLYFTNGDTTPNTATYHDGVIYYNTHSLFIL